MTLPEGYASHAVDPESMPWVFLGHGTSFKPLGLFRQRHGRILLLRLEPGTLVPKHRHLGEVHAFNLSGHRKLLETGEIVGPGGYVHEPAGNVDSWIAVGDEPVVVQIVAHGAMEFLDARGGVTQRDTATSLLETYRSHCAQHGIAPLDLDVCHG